MDEITSRDQTATMKLGILTWQSMGHSWPLELLLEALPLIYFFCFPDCLMNKSTITYLRKLGFFCFFLFHHCKRWRGAGVWLIALNEMGLDCEKSKKSNLLQCFAYWPPQHSFVKNIQRGLELSSHFYYFIWGVGYERKLRNYQHLQLPLKQTRLTDIQLNRSRNLC